MVAKVASPEAAWEASPEAVREASPEAVNMAFPEEAMAASPEEAVAASPEAAKVALWDRLEWKAVEEEAPAKDLNEVAWPEVPVGAAALDPAPVTEIPD